jgi:protein-S-isoprenylcysteine O-methyltransferase Ste14
MGLHLKTWLSFFCLFVVMGLLIFVPAGTMCYWQAWVFLAVYFGASLIMLLCSLKKDRALLERRMKGGPTAEKRKAQRIIMSFLSLGFIALLVVPGLDHRMQWSYVPFYISILGAASVAGTFVCWYFVFCENTFAASTVEIASDQKVISTGPYAIVRHPMYASGLFMFFGMPLALGSYWGLIVTVFMTPFLLWRIFDEERLLLKDLPGYAEYCRKVRWRLIPGLF